MTLDSASASPQLVAAEIYAASLLAIQVDSPAERAYLAMLAPRLRPPDELVGELQQLVDQERIQRQTLPEGADCIGATPEVAVTAPDHAARGRAALLDRKGMHSCEPTR